MDVSLGKMIPENGNNNYFLLAYAQTQFSFAASEFHFSFQKRKLIGWLAGLLTYVAIFANQKSVFHIFCVVSQQFQSVTGVKVTAGLFNSP